MQSVVVIQARTNSSRLPGKVLLDFSGVPLVVLAARRAANTGRKVIVATSAEATDDVLAATLDRHGIPCFRGELDNVLHRFTDALRDYQDDTIVFRLTADNVVPDGYLLDEMEQDFLARKLDYLTSTGPASGLPYGVSAEVMWLSDLREADASATTVADREHVTPWIRRKRGVACFEKYAVLSLGLHRCTIDCLDEYLSVRALFEGLSAPVDLPFHDLIEKLHTVDAVPLLSKPASKLVIGTAQLGMAYGVANTSGQPSLAEAREILRTGIRNGVGNIDTARAYGDSEAVIARALGSDWAGRVEIVTKLSPLDDCPVDATEEVAIAFAEASFFKSRTALAGQRISTLLLHRSPQMQSWNGAIRRLLLEWRNEGHIGNIGVSVQTPEELSDALDDQEIGHIQLPYNLLDHRWDALIEKVRAQRASRPLTIHVRSVLLQGLLISRDPFLWHRAHADAPDLVWAWMDQQMSALGRRSTIDLCVAYIASQDWADGLVIGMESLDQLNENLRLFENPPLAEAEIEAIRHSRPRLDERSLNPALWI